MALRLRSLHFKNFVSLVLIATSAHSTLASESCDDVHFARANESSSAMRNEVPFVLNDSFHIATSEITPDSAERLKYRTGYQARTYLHDEVLHPETQTRVVSEAQFNLDRWSGLAMSFPQWRGKFVLLDAGERDLLLDRAIDEKILKDHFALMSRPNSPPPSNLIIQYQGKRLEIERAKGLIRSAVFKKLEDTYLERKERLSPEFVARLTRISDKIVRFANIFAIFDSSFNLTQLNDSALSQSFLLALQYHSPINQRMGSGFADLKKSQLYTQLPMFAALGTWPKVMQLHEQLVKMAQGKKVAEISRLLKIKNLPPAVESALFGRLILRAFEQAEKDGVGEIVIIADAVTERIFRREFRFSTVASFEVEGVKKNLMNLSLSQNPTSPYQITRQELVTGAGGLREEALLLKDLVLEP